MHRLNKIVALRNYDKSYCGKIPIFALTCYNAKIVLLFHCDVITNMFQLFFQHLHIIQY